MEGDANDSSAHHMYVKTHGDYAPGEQRRRGYDWQAAGVNPDNTVFGQVDHHPYMVGRGVHTSCNKPIADVLLAYLTEYLCLILCELMPCW